MHLMAKQTLFWLLLALVAFTFTACEEGASFHDMEASVEEAAEVELRGALEAPYGGAKGLMGRRPRCFTLVFPLELVFPDGATVEVADRRELLETSRNWKAENPDAEERPRIAFPHELQLADGTTVTVDGPEEVREIAADCYPNHPFPVERCFELVYPVTVVFPDGSTAEAAEREAFGQILRDWAAENPDAEDRPGLEFPYEVTLAAGSVATINDEDELAALLSDCRENRPALPVLGIKPCIKLIYPVEIAFPDGSTAEAGDRRAALDLLVSWKEENPDAESQPELVYPVEVELRDGAIEMVNSAEEFAALREGCPGRRAGRILLGVRDCFRVQFPLAFELPSGRTIRVANRSELRRFLHRRNSGPRPSRRHPQLVFPIEIKFEEGQTATIEDEDALREAIASCVEGDE